MKNRIDVLSEKSGAEDMIKLPTTRPKNNPFLKNKGQVSATPTLKHDDTRKITLKKEYSSSDIDTTREKMNFNYYLSKIIFIGRNN